MVKLTFQPPEFAATHLAATHLNEAIAIFNHWGGNGLTRLSLRPENRLSFSTDGRACVGYAIAGRTAVVLGDPVGPPDAIASALDRFILKARGQGCDPVFCGLTPAVAQMLVKRGFVAISVGDEALVNPYDVSLKGCQWEEVRLTLNRARHLGLRFSWVSPEARTPQFLTTLREVSQAWLSNKALPELRFAFGSLESLSDPDIRLGIARDESGAIHGFATWVPVPARGGWMLELIRRRPSMRRLSGYLVASSLLSFQGEGVSYASLCGTPLANVLTRWRPPLRWAASAFGAWIKPLYDYQAIYRFKRKFNPTWQPLYVAYRRYANPLRVFYAIGSASGLSISPATVVRSTLDLTFFRGRQRGQTL